MKKLSILAVAVLTMGLTSCGGGDKVIRVAASESPHAVILNSSVVKNALSERGYSLEVTVLDWTIQNDGVYTGDYDANYFQHRVYLQDFDGGLTSYQEDYTYTKVEPLVGVHFEPLRIYCGKKTVEQFASEKTSSTYVICNDVSNEIRALDLLVDNGVIDDYDLDESGAPTNLPSNITPIAEELLVASMSEYDYAVLPCNTALTGNVDVDDGLPVEGMNIAELYSNILAVNVSSYENDSTYKDKVDALADVLILDEVADFIDEEFRGLIEPVKLDFRS